jgi:hypothetical protein
MFSNDDPNTNGPMSEEEMKAYGFDVRRMKFGRMRHA